ncbi:MAG: hypothetical protein JXA49_07875 [Actinobacteria bacterium]|nr:hypothetical protein [Actinomycetota bacterium]
MKVKVSNWFFNFLLVELSLFLQFFFLIASVRNPSLRKDLAENEFTLLIKTTDNKNIRHFKMDGGRLKSSRSDCPDPDFSLVWTDTMSFNSVLLKLNPMLMMKELSSKLQAGNLAVQVNLEGARWFMAMFGKTMMVYRHFFSLGGS